MFIFSLNVSFYHAFSSCVSASLLQSKTQVLFFFCPLMKKNEIKFRTTIWIVIPHMLGTYDTWQEYIT